MRSSRMKKFHTRSGFGECYPTDMLETFKRELQNSTHEIGAKDSSD